MRQTSGIRYFITIFMAATLLLTSCIKQPVEPKDDGILFTFLETSGAPGQFIMFTVNASPEQLESTFINFAGVRSVVIPTEKEDIYKVMVPVLDPTTIQPLLESNDGETLGSSPEFTVLPLMDTGLPPGEVVQTIINDQLEIVRVLKNGIVPSLRALSYTDTTNIRAFERVLEDSELLLNFMVAQQESLSPEEMLLIDQVLFASGMMQQGSLARITDFAQTISEGTLHGEFTRHYVAVGLDGISAVISAVRLAWTVATIATTIATAGVGIFMAIGSVALALYDNAIDGILPTDLISIHVVSLEPDQVPLNGSVQLQFIGEFRSQDEWTDAIIDVGLSTLFAAAGGEANPLADLFTEVLGEVAERLAGLALNVAEEGFLPADQYLMTESFPIDPRLYATPFSFMTNIFSSIFFFSINFEALDEIVSDLESSTYFVEDENTAIYHHETGFLEGENTGTSELNYGAFRFRKHEISVLGIEMSLLGLEFPRALGSHDDETIAPFLFSVGDVNQNSLLVNSNPHGANVYLDGSPLYGFTPLEIDYVEAGWHTVRVQMDGYSDYETSINIEDESCYVINAVLGVSIPPVPYIEIDTPQQDMVYNDNLITISGDIQLLNPLGEYSTFFGDEAILTINGMDQSISVSSGSFSEQASIRSGVNEIQIRATSANGNTGYSQLVEVVGDFVAPDLEITLIWNTAKADLDLHVWNPNGDHCFYQNTVIDGGSLDIDDLRGYGPETFTSSDPISGDYLIMVNAYGLYSDEFTDATISVSLAGESATIYGPHRFELGDANGDDPNAWWELGTVTIKNGNLLFSSDTKQYGYLPTVIQDISLLPHKDHTISGSANTY